MYKTKRRIIKDWKNKISKGEFKFVYESGYPNNFQEVLDNVMYRDIEDCFQEQYKYNNSVTNYFTNIVYIRGRKATQQIEEIYKEFLQIQREVEYKCKRTTFWHKIKTSIYYNCDVSVQYDIDDSDEEIEHDIIRCLEKALIVNVDWNKLVLFLSAITNLASVMVSIILAVKS